MNNVLTKTDLEDLNMLLRVSELIWEDYNELLKLEHAGKMGTKEFDYFVERIKSSAALENNIYDRLTDNIEKCIGSILFLEDKFSANFEFPDLEKGISLIWDDNFSAEDMIIVRMHNRFCLRYKDFFKQKKEKEINDMLAYVPEFIKKSQIELMKASIDLQMFIQEDIVSLVITILSQEIEKSEGSLLNYELLRAKYCYSMQLPNIENSLLSTKFVANQHPYLIHQCTRGIFQITDEEFEMIKSNTNERNLLRLINILLSYGDLKLLSIQNLHHAICIQTILRAILVIEGEEKCNKILMEIENILNQDIKGHKLAKKMILDAFEFAKKDRSIPQYVSFNL